MLTYPLGKVALSLCNQRSMANSSFRAAFFLVAVLHLAASGCAQTWHDKVHWKAEDYFDDPQVIALCHAIEANDLAKMDELVTAGADVNARGKGNMTPLLWAYPDNKLERFSWLLEHGADPNVIFTDDFGLKGLVSYKGTSVTHLAAGTWFPGYFDAVFAHGGDPNLVCSTKLIGNTTPIFAVIRGPCKDKSVRVARLIELGADLNHRDSGGTPPADKAVSWMGQYDIALQILKAGADFKAYHSNSNKQLVHVVVMQERTLKRISAQRLAAYQELVDWLKEQGVSFDDARKDLERWRGFKDYPKMMGAEVAARKQREAKAAAPPARETD